MDHLSLRVQLVQRLTIYLLESSAVMALSQNSQDLRSSTKLKKVRNNTQGTRIKKQELTNLEVKVTTTPT